MEAAALFLFAHPDDEFGVYHCLEQERRLGRRIHCAYLTDGGAGNASPERRLAESIAVLQRFAVAPEDVHFPGHALTIPDGALPGHLARVGTWVEAHLEQHGAPQVIYLPAWEGGHQDHDGLHAAALVVLQRRGLLGRARQFPLYHGQDCKTPWFKVLTPLAANGAVETTRIPWISRVHYLGLCLGYPSQWRSWIGLFPFVAWHYLVRGRQSLQPVSMARTAMRPHAGALYYEQREFHTWEQMCRQVSHYVEAAGQR